MDCKELLGKKWMGKLEKVLNEKNISFIGAEAVVTKNVPDYALIIGNPGRIEGWMCKCGVKLNFDEQGVSRCKTCTLVYEKIKEVTVRNKM